MLIPINQQLYYQNNILYPIFSVGYMGDVNTHGYYINTNGILYSAKSKKVLNGNLDKDGYVRIDFPAYDVTYNKSKLLHKIVLNNFNFNPDWENLQINHINGIKTDNRVINLEWCSPIHNIIHSRVTHLNNSIGDNNPVTKFSSEIVYFILDKYLEGHSINNITIMVSNIYKEIKYVTVSHICICRIRHFDITNYMKQHNYTITNIFGNKDFIINLVKTKSRDETLNYLNIQPNTKEMLAINLTYQIINRNLLWNDYLNY